MGKEKELFLEEGKEARWEPFRGGGGMMPRLLQRLKMVMMSYSWVSPGRRALRSPFSKRVFWRSQGGPNLVVVGKNKIKTFPPFSCPLLSYYLRAPENQGIL